MNISPRARVAPGPVTLIFTLSPSYVTKNKLTSKTTERFSYEYPETEIKTKTKTKLIAAVTQDEEKYYKELEI